MSNDYFKFKQFTVHHDLCAMKVGTDGVLLGAWAHGGRRILDIGTGSGVVALMMAQRFTEAQVTAIDIDHGACEQARSNASASPFARRISVMETPLQDFHSDTYGAIVCNPPFFADALKNPDKRKAIARHADTLPFHDLFSCCASLLSDDGELSLVLPASCKAVFDMEALFSGLFPSRICAIKTVPRKAVSRYLLAYKKHPSAVVEECMECINNADMTRSAWCHALTKDFYL